MKGACIHVDSGSFSSFSATEKERRSSRVKNVTLPSQFIYAFVISVCIAPIDSLFAVNYNVY